jgi:hypothetical protein
MIITIFFTIKKVEEGINSEVEKLFEIEERNKV